MRILPIECDGVEYHDNGLPELGQLCIATKNGTYLKGFYGGSLPYCKKFKMFKCVEYTCSELTLIKIDAPVKDVVWVTDNLFRTTKN
jgi:hypothetical protein